MTQETFRMPTPEEIRAMVGEANQLRAEALKSLFARSLSALRRALRAAGAAIVGLGESIAEARHAQGIYVQLSRLSDRELADMGLTRGDISAVVAGVFRRENEPASVQPTVASVVEPAAKPRPAMRPAKPEIREAA